jgi:hypothetical protein
MNAFDFLMKRALSACGPLQGDPEQLKQLLNKAENDKGLVPVSLNLSPELRAILSRKKELELTDREISALIRNEFTLVKTAKGSKVMLH